MDLVFLSYFLSFNFPPTGIVLLTLNFKNKMKSLTNLKLVEIHSVQTLRQELPSKTDRAFYDDEIVFHFTLSARDTPSTLHTLLIEIFDTISAVTAFPCQRRPLSSTLTSIQRFNRHFNTISYLSPTFFVPSCLLFWKLTFLLLPLQCCWSRGSHILHHTSCIS